MAKQNYNIYECGKIPPQSIELEEAVLGAMILERNVFQDVLEYLSPESFYKDAHQIIFRAALNIYDRKEQIDLLTIVEELRRINHLEEVGGAIYIAKLTSKVGSAGHIEQHAKIVAEKYIRREFIRLANDLSNSMFDDEIDLLSTINEFDTSKMNILSFTKDEEKHIKEAVNEMVDHSVKLNKNLIPKGLPTGYTYYDDFSGGMQRGDLIIVAGETSNGKTTLSLNILKNTCEKNTPAAIFSYEMTSFQLAARLLGHSQKVSSKDIIRGAVTEQDLKIVSKNAYKLTSSELYIVKPSGSSFNKLKRDIIRMVKIYGLKLIVIDYLQLLSNPKHGASSADMIGEMANALKSLAVELGICIIAISQLARNQSNPRPTLSRLKGSGDIENAADTVIFTYLPYKYNMQYENVNGENVEINENAIIIVGKGRNIGTTEFILEFKKEIPAFFNFHQSEITMNEKGIYEPNRQFEPKITPF